MYSHHGCGRMYNWQKDATKGGSNLSAQNRIRKTLDTCSDNSVHNHQKRAHTTALKQARRTKTSWKEISSGCTKTRHRFFSLKTPPAPSLCKLLYILDGTCAYENKAHHYYSYQITNFVQQLGYTHMCTYVCVELPEFLSYVGTHYHASTCALCSDGRNLEVQSELSRHLVLFQQFLATYLLNQRLMRAECPDTSFSRDTKLFSPAIPYLLACLSLALPYIRKHCCRTNMPLRRRATTVILQHTQ